jgi:hypothetical protein
MNIDVKIELEFYFTFDGLIIAHSTDYKIIGDMYIKYYNKYGPKHEYYLYAVNKQDLKDFIKIKE